MSFQQARCNSWLAFRLLEAQNIHTIKQPKIFPQSQRAERFCIRNFTQGLLTWVSRRLCNWLFHDFHDLKICYLFMVVLGLFCCTQAFSSCGAWASGFSLRCISYCKTQAQSLRHMCLNASWYVDSPWTRDGSRVPCIGSRFLSAVPQEVLAIPLKK